MTSFSARLGSDAEVLEAGGRSPRTPSLTTDQRISHTGKPRRDENEPIDLPVLQDHHDHLPLDSESGPVETRGGRCPRIEGPAVNPSRSSAL